MTVTFGDGTVVEIGTPQPTVLPLPAPATPAVALVPVKGDKGDQGDKGDTGDTGPPVDPTELTDQIDDAVTAAVADHTPGIELGYAERSTLFQTTATAPGAAALIPSLVITITGQGRPVDLVFFCQSVRHSVADAAVLPYLEINGSAVSALAGSAVVSSPSTTLGRFALIWDRPVLADGVVYTIKVGIYGEVAGTSSALAANNAKMFLSAVSR